MQRRVFWHGCLTGVLCLACPAQGGEPTHAQSRVFDIAYVVNREALPLEAVALWYTLDRGRSWHQYGADDDRQSPFVFNAPAEGLFGLFFVVTNATGASSQPPTASAKPHHWVFVDYTPPIAQLHSPRVTSVLGQPVVQVRWTAIDAHLVARPIELAYRQMPDATWYPLSADSLANTGRFDWRIPAGLDGAIAIRVTVTDKGGNRIHSETQVIDITLSDGPRLDETGLSEEQPAGGTDVMLASATGGSRERARVHYEEGVACRKRGDDRRGVSCMRKAIALDPEMTEGLVELADMLYRLGDVDRADEAYGLALKRRPTMRAALRGAAMVDRQRNNYSRAARRLRTILRYNPNDAEVWMNLGDVAVFQGDGILARDCYERATTVGPKEKEVIEQARQRLGLMDEMSRTYERKASR